MARQRICSECGASLEGHGNKAKTCSTSCRQKRSRRLSAQKKAASAAAAEARMPAVLGDVAQAKDVAADVMKEELRPIVREALTEDVLHGIDRLVKLTPTAIDRLEGDLDSDDETIRQRAYTLLLRYTMGNPSVAPPPQDVQPAGMTVVFNVPRPEDVPQDATSGVESTAEELRTCSECGETKAAREFVGASTRCQACHEAIRLKALQRVGDA